MDALVDEPVGHCESAHMVCLHIPTRPSEQVAASQEARSTVSTGASEARPPHLQALAEALSHLQALQANGVSAVLVDHHGQQMASVGPLPSLETIGALGSGVLSVSDSLVRLLGEHWADHVVVTSADRQVVIFPASGSVAVLVVVAPRPMALGPVLWAARRCCVDLGKATVTEQTALPGGIT